MLICLSKTHKYLSFKIDKKVKISKKEKNKILVKKKLKKSEADNRHPRIQEIIK